MRILLVEDDLPLADALTALLSRAGHAVDCTHDGLSAEALVGAERFDLVILDLNLPDKDGLSVLRTLRARREAVPILVLTARGDPADRVAGLDLGADDYMVKPFDVREFEARVRSILRRQAGLHAAEVQIGPVRLDLTARRFSVNGEDMDLPARELALLELFFLRAGHVVAKEAIVQSLTTLDDSLSDNAIEQYVSRLRRRLQPHGLTLRTARGLGYLLERPVEPAVDRG
jgi:two-component system OmpR family response regulator